MTTTVSSSKNRTAPTQRLLTEEEMQAIELSLPSGYMDETVYCPDHKNHVFPVLSRKTGLRYFLCTKVRKDSHFLEDPNKDPEGDWGARNNFVNEQLTNQDD